MESVKEILEQLNTLDENTGLEAKKGSEIDRSILETICAFANEPNLGGGIIVLGIEKEKNSLFPTYVVCGVDNTDKLQADLSTQCASIFNRPIRPKIDIEYTKDGKKILKIEVNELPAEQKPLYFSKSGIPRGIYRRIGSTDQQCTEEDLSVFFSSDDSFDASVVADSTLDDISDEAVDLYRYHRKNANENAEELNYNDSDLLFSLNAIKKVNQQWKLTYTGLIVFGKKASLRRLLPMFRVDYIRVPGKKWIENPEERFTSTLDMRGALLELLPRTIAAIADDLPKGFYLPEGKLQAQTTIGLPYRVLREAIVNAFIHRSYKVNQPIQIIRYSNRIEIKNAGFSLKSLDSLGESGSVIRNPSIAAIFHETNLAETKGSGISIMRRLLKKSQMMLPTFESNHGANEFIARLLLHHLLSEQDHQWLAYFENYKLNDDQKTGLIFIREIGALDNLSYRQLTSANAVQATADLRKMVEWGLIKQKGKARLTYYIPAPSLESFLNDGNENTGLSTNPDGLSTNPDGLSTNLDGLSTNPGDLFADIPDSLQTRLRHLGKRAKLEEIQDLIVDLCRIKSYNITELAHLLNRKESHVRNIYIKPLMQQRKINFTIPEVINHPKQAYITIT